MNDRIEIYHRPFDAAFNRTSFSREDHLHLAALNRQTQARYHAYAQQPIQSHTSEMHDYLTHWRSTAFSSARILHNGTIGIQNHDIDSLPPTGPTFPERPQFGLQQKNFKLRLALYQAIERDALQRIEQLDPCPGTQLLRLFWTIPQDRMLSFDSLEDPPLPEPLDTLAGHCLRADDQELFYLDWGSLDDALAALSMNLTVAQIPHWDPTEDRPVDPRRALVSWVWNGDHTQWARTVRLVSPDYKL